MGPRKESLDKPHLAVLLATHDDSTRGFRTPVVPVLGTGPYSKDPIFQKLRDL